MSSVDEKIARAQAEQADRPVHKDVTVSLDSPLAEERAKLLDDLGALNQEREERIAEAQSVLTLAPDTALVDKRINNIAARLKKIDDIEQDRLINVRVYRAKGDDWLDTVSAHPARLNSAIDRGVGYNVNTLTIAALVTHGRILEGDEELQRDATGWASLAGLLAGGEFVKLVNAVYEINVLDSQKRTEALKKSFEVATASAKK